MTMIPDQLVSIGGRLLLRRPLDTDLDRLFEIYSDPQTNLYNPLPMTKPAEGAAMLNSWVGHWAKEGFGPWAIEENGTDAVLGFGGLSWKIIDGCKRINLGYRFAKEAWGRGYATEMGRTAIAQAGSALRAKELYAYVRPTNAPSIRVLERLGMSECGTFDDVPDQPPSLIFRRAVDESSPDFASGDRSP